MNRSATIVLSIVALAGGWYVWKRARSSTPDAYLLESFLAGTALAAVFQPKRGVQK